MNNHELEEAWVTWEVLTATRKIRFEIEEAGFLTIDSFLESSKGLFSGIEAKRDEYKFFAEWYAERQGDEEKLQKKQEGLL